MTNLFTFLGGIALLAAVIWLGSIGFDRQEVVECRQWESQAEEYELFFLTHWQDEQCRAHGIVINAPVK